MSITQVVTCQMPSLHSFPNTAFSTGLSGQASDFSTGLSVEPSIVFMPDLAPGQGTACLRNAILDQIIRVAIESTFPFSNPIFRVSSQRKIKEKDKQAVNKVINKKIQNLNLLPNEVSSAKAYVKEKLKCIPVKCYYLDSNQKKFEKTVIFDLTCAPYTTCVFSIEGAGFFSQALDSGASVSHSTPVPTPVPKETTQKASLLRVLLGMPLKV